MVKLVRTTAVVHSGHAQLLAMACRRDSLPLHRVGTEVFSAVYCPPPKRSGQNLTK